MLDSKLKAVPLAMSLLATAGVSASPPSNSIPHQLPEWQGTAGRVLSESTPDFVGHKKANRDRPNVLVIMLDDAGYSNAASYGGAMKTDTFDRIGDEGLRYTHMSVAATCSPTRGSLLTGQNIHTIGTGIISELSTGYEGYNSQIDYTTPSIAKILNDNGYATAAFGKWHNTPAEEATPVGPFHAWPTQMWGFEYFYGFLGGETNQFHPLLVENTSFIDTPKTNADGSEYHFTHDMTDKAIWWLDNWDGLRDEPFFMYYTPGAIHAPLQVPEDWRDKYKGQFDQGWDVYREEVLARQKKLGLMPEGTELLERPESLPAWEDFNEEEQAYLARQMEVNAAFMEHTDFHVGRLIDHLEEMGELDNTLVIYFTADNGATAEGTPTGTFSELTMQNGFPPLTMEQQLEKLEEFGGLEEWGGPHMHNHYSVAWAWASSTPFQWTKQVASHFGGTVVSTALRYPEGIDEKHNGEWRRQFQNVVNIFPTILDVTGVELPEHVNGQKVIEGPGESLSYAWNNPDVETNHPTQYFEMVGYMGLYHEGWTLAGAPYRVPWTLDPNALANFDPLKTEWELYNIEKDPSQSVNLAHKYPEKVKELEKIFWEEAEKYGALPIGGSLGRFLQPESSPAADAKLNWDLTPNVYRVPEMSAPRLLSNNYEVNAYISADETTEGVIYAIGERMGGQSLFIKDGKLRFSYSTLGLHWADFEGVDIPHGDIKVTLKQTMKEARLNGPALIELFINDEKVGELNLEATVGLGYTGHEPFDIGRDSGMPVNREYEDRGEFIFTSGQLHRVTFDLE